MKVFRLNTPKKVYRFGELAQGDFFDDSNGTLFVKIAPEGKSNALCVEQNVLIGFEEWAPVTLRKFVVQEIH